MGDVGGLEDYERDCGLASERGRMDEASLLTFNYADALLSYRGPGAAAEALREGLDAARSRRLEAIEALPARSGSVSAGLLGEWDAETARRLTVNLVEALGMLGEWDEALSIAAELIPELERSEAGSDLVIVRTQEAVLRVCRGEAGLRGAVPGLAGAARPRERDPVDLRLRPARVGARAASGWGRREAALGLLDVWEARPRPGSGPELRGLPARGRADGAGGRRRRARRPSLHRDRLHPAHAAQRPRLRARPGDRAPRPAGRGGGPLPARRRAAGASSACPTRRRTRCSVAGAA